MGFVTVMVGLPQESMSHVAPIDNAIQTTECFKMHIDITLVTKYLEIYVEN